MLSLFIIRIPRRKYHRNSFADYRYVLLRSINPVMGDDVMIMMMMIIVIVMIVMVMVMVMVMLMVMLMVMVMVLVGVGVMVIIVIASIVGIVSKETGAASVGN